MKKHPNRSYDLWGLKHHEDDAILQSKIDGLLTTVPDFHYDVIHYDGKEFGVITIPIQKGGPFFLSKDFVNEEGKIQLRENTVYFRRSSKNETARQPEDLRRIGAWFSGLVTKEIDDPVLSQNWNEFLEATQKFEKGRDMTESCVWRGDGLQPF